MEKKTVMSSIVPLREGRTDESTSSSRGSRIPVANPAALMSTSGASNNITIPPIKSPTLSPSRIPIPTRVISPRHQVSSNIIQSTAAVPPRPDSPPQLGESPSVSSMSSSQISTIASPNDTPKHHYIAMTTMSEEENANPSKSAPNLTDTFNVMTSSCLNASKLPQTSPFLSSSLQYTSPYQHSSVLSDLMKDYQFSPSVRYDLSSSQKDQPITTSESDSTLTLSSLSATSKPSLFSPSKPNVAAAILSSTNTAAGSGMEKGAISSSFVTSPMELTTSLSATKLQLQLELEKETLKKELDDTKSTMEFLENENTMIQEKCSKFEVDNTSLQMRNTQLIEQLEQSKMQQKEEQKMKDKVNEREKVTLLEQLSQIKQEKDGLGERLLNIQKEHSLCSQQIEIANKVNTGTDKQLNTMRIALKESEDKIRHLHDLLKNIELEKDNLRRNFELEKSQSTELQSSFVTLKQSLEGTNKKLDDFRQKCQLKDELLSRKESQLSLLQGELNIMKDNYRSLASSHDSIAMELQVYQQDLENKKSQLSEVLLKKENGETNIRDLSEKVSNYERQLKEKETSLDNEGKERKQLQHEVGTLKKKCQTLDEQFALQVATSRKQEREIANLVIERDTLKSQVAKKDNELRNNQMSSGHEVSELKNFVSAMETKHKAQSETIEEKEEAVKSLMLQKRTLECSLEFEKEQKTSLNQTIVCLNEELETFKQQCQVLESEKDTLSRTATTKAKEVTETEAIMRKQIDELEKETKSKETKLHTVTVQLTQREAELERALGKISDLQTQVALLNADVDNNKQLVENLKLKLQRLHETKNQEIGDVKQKLEDKRSEIVKLSSQIDSLQFELKEKEDEMMTEKETTQCEKKSSEELRSQLLMSEMGTKSLQSHLSQSEERVKKLELTLAEKKTQLQVLEEKNHSLVAQLQNTQKSLQESQKAHSDERTHFTETLGSMGIQHKQEMTKMVQDLESLQLHVKQTQDSLANTQQQLQKIKYELNMTNANLKTKEEENHKLLSSIEKEVTTRTEIITQLTSLQSKYDTLCNDKQTLEEQLSLLSSEKTELGNKLSSLQQHHSRLQQEMQLQNEVHSTSAKRMEEKEKESIGQYERKIKELKIKLQKSEEIVKEMGGEMSRVQLEHGALQTQLSHMTKMSDNLQSQLNEKKANLASDKQKVNQLERTLEQEKLVKSQMQESLTREMTRHQELKNKLEHLKEKLSQTVTSKGSVEALLEDEKRNTMLLQDKIRELENIQEVLQVTLRKEKESFFIDRQKIENDHTTIKKKYQSEKKILKDTLKGLQSEVEILRSTVDSHSKEITKLDKALNGAEQDKEKLTDKKAELERLLREKKELLKLAEVKIQTQETQISQLQVQLGTLHQAQLDVEKYKKTIETKQRDELQRILTEVTEHMEEQYTAHHYLEKLRADNETLAMKEKDRKIGHLKNELKAQKKELKKEKLQVESLSLEAKYLKAKQREHERSRERASSRLEKVGTLSTGASGPATSMLSNSLPLTAGHIPPIPISTSTPLINRKSLQ